MLSDKNLNGEQGSPDQPLGWKKFFRRRRSQNPREEILAQHQEQNDLDKKLVLAVNEAKQKKMPSWQQLRRVGRFFSDRERLVVEVASALTLAALIFLAINFWFFTLHLAPDYGGEYSEGLVGAPQYLNPVLAAANDVDLDITSLIFCGLLRREVSGLANDLVESYSVSADQKEYTLVLKTNALWQDNGQPVTVDDVLFTFDLIKDSQVGSPLAVSFRGITAEKIDDRTIKFILKEPFTPFLSTLTFGILPEHLWSNVAPANLRLAELNLKPVGCGPFKFFALKRDSQGSIKSLTLQANNNYYAGRPYLDKVIFKFYPDFVSLRQAVENKNVLAASYLPQEIQNQIFAGQSTAKGFKRQLLNLPQYAAIFFNQNNNEALKTKVVRQALYQAIDRQRLVHEVLHDEAAVIDSPILPGSIGYDATAKKYNYDSAAATVLLDNAKWRAITPNDYITWQREQEKKNLPEGQEFIDRSDAERLVEIADQEYFRRQGDQVLTITLTAVDQPESKAAAEIIKEDWQAIGARTILNIIAPEDIRREAIKPRQYQALLYSEIVGYDPDPYPFWHSSQNADPGLNLAVFTDKRVDRYLEAARQTADVAAREENYKKFQEILTEEVPAIFLYSPTYSYIISERVKGLSVEKMFTPADRLSDLKTRYLETRRSW